MKFKVGDWVRSKDGTDISRVSIDTIKWYEEIEDKDIVNEWELWQPQLGEWCWFWDNYDNNLLSRFVKISKKGNYKSDENVLKYNKYNIIKLSNKWKYCEPFTGELPSFIKN